MSIDNKPTYLWYVSLNQINVQVPYGSSTGFKVPVQVTTANGTAMGLVTLAQFAPSLSLFDSRYVAAVIPTPDGSDAYEGGTHDFAGPAGHFAFKSRAVKPGEILVLYAVGFGPTIRLYLPANPFRAPPRQQVPSPLPSVANLRL